MKGFLAGIQCISHWNVSLCLLWNIKAEGGNVCDLHWSVLPTVIPMPQYESILNYSMAVNIHCWISQHTVWYQLLNIRLFEFLDLMPVLLLSSSMEKTRSSHSLMALAIQRENESPFLHATLLPVSIHYYIFKCFGTNDKMICQMYIFFVSAC